LNGTGIRFHGVVLLAERLGDGAALPGSCDEDAQAPIGGGVGFGFPMGERGVAVWVFLVIRPAVAVRIDGQAVGSHSNIVKADVVGGRGLLYLVGCRGVVIEAEQVGVGASLVKQVGARAGVWQVEGAEPTGLVGDGVGGQQDVVGAVR